MGLPLWNRVALQHLPLEEHHQARPIRDYRHHLQPHLRWKKNKENGSRHSMIMNLRFVFSLLSESYWLPVWFIGSRRPQIERRSANTSRRKNFRWLVSLLPKGYRTLYHPDAFLISTTFQLGYLFSHGSLPLFVCVTFRNSSAGGLGNSMERRVSFPRHMSKFCSLDTKISLSIFLNLFCGPSANQNWRGSIND